MEQGLAATMTYVSGEGQNTHHYYAGAGSTPKKKEKKMACKTKGKTKPGKGGKK